MRDVEKQDRRVIESLREDQDVKELYSEDAVAYSQNR